MFVKPGAAHRPPRGLLACAVFFLSATAFGAGTDECAGTALANVGGVAQAWKLAGGGVAAYARMNINIDGYVHAYHRRNADAGALLHLCNAGRVVLADGSSYEGAQDNATCTGRFMADLARIEHADWQNPSVGAVQWYGILGQGTVSIGRKLIRSVVPVLNKDGSGFYVSPTALFDHSVADVADQTRYVNPLRVASAVIPRSLNSQGIELGSFGVAVDITKHIAVPFVVGDVGPRIGEGSLALARLVAGADLSDAISRKNRFVGQVDRPDVLWIFFGGATATFDSKEEAALIDSTKVAYERWGGDARLARCLATVPKSPR